MKQGAWILGALFAGALFGACMRDVARDAILGQAHAQGGHRYKVVGASMGGSGYEEDLNKAAADGWRYVGPIPQGGDRSSLLVFER